MSNNYELQSTMKQTHYISQCNVVSTFFPPFFMTVSSFNQESHFYKCRQKCSLKNYMAYEDL